MKISTGDCLSILRMFNVADLEDKQRSIEYLKVTNPSAINTMASFRFKRAHYHLLFDETAFDDVDYIESQVRVESANKKFDILKNPTSNVSTYGLPFRGKDCYVVREKSETERLDIYLATKYPEHSRSSWQKFIRRGDVMINGEVAESAKAEVTTGDRVEIHTPDKTDYTADELPIVYLDDDVIVMNKPIGVLTHSKGALNDEFTVAEFLRRYTDVGLETSRPGIVHRLDRDTSGIIIGARNNDAFEVLKSQFADRKANKTYLAVVQGIPKQPKARIDLPIARNPNQPSTFRVDAKGKQAVTDYEVLASTANGDKSLVRLRPHTGRTHQLRVHMSHIGNPIVGDRVYGKSGDRLMLHAWQLEITTPPSTRRTFTAPVPAEFTTDFPEVKL